MEIVALVALQLGNCAQDSDGICTKPAAQGFRQEELMAFPAKPSLLQSRFMPLLLELELAARLNEFQFPGFITQPGAGGRGDLWLHQNLSEFLRVPVNWSSALHSALLHAPFFLRTLAFPNLLSGPLSPAAGGQLQQTSGGSLQVQHCTREAAGHPMEEGRATSGPALPWSSPTWQRLPGGGGRGWWELPVRCQPAWHRHTPLHCHKSQSCG